MRCEGLNDEKKEEKMEGGSERKSGRERGKVGRGGGGGWGGLRTIQDGSSIYNCKESRK